MVEISMAQLLKSIDFGGDVAEHEQRLSEYFVATSSFEEVVSDEVDLIIGPKGSGKTAIFRLLSDDQYEIPSLDDVDIVPAFNVQGAVIFRRLVSDLPADEVALRWIWSQYIVGILADHVIRAYGDRLDTKALREALRRAGIPAITDQKSLLQALIGRLTAKMSRLSAEGQASFGTFLPKVSGKLTSPRTHGRSPQVLSQTLMI